jgi:hypothetical protein
LELEQLEHPEPLLELSDEEVRPALRCAKTDICFSRSSLWHLGHFGLLLPMTRASNSLPQERQIKSNKGICFFSHFKKIMTGAFQVICSVECSRWSCSNLTRIIDHPAVYSYLGSIVKFLHKNDFAEKHFPLCKFKIAHIRKMTGIALRTNLPSPGGTAENIRKKVRQEIFPAAP